MRAETKARALIVGTVAGGAVAVALAAVTAADAPLVTLALFGAAVVLSELLHVTGDEHSLDPLDAQSFSFSSGVHVAAVIVLGPWAGALVAAFGVVVVDGLRRAPARRLAFNASVFALAALAGGYAFQLLGGRVGHLDLPADFPAVGALALTAYGVNLILVASVIAFSAGSSLSQLLREKVRAEYPAATAEAGLGLVAARFALYEPWAIVACAPLLLAMYNAYARHAQLRRETARALETFANIVDERDHYTFEHSARVAGHVTELGRALDLPQATIARLRWAGRLHDLGKITVDAAVLRKPGRLTESEWEAMRRHPRLSARLLGSFRFAAEEATAVEYHHERFDGRGYYGIGHTDVPLAAHFLVVADTFDAMTSDRSYRRGLSRERALREIEAGAGTQFHPAVAKAFVAVKRGRAPADVLSAAELAELRGVLRRGRVLPGVRRIVPERTELLGVGAVVAALGALAVGRPLLAAAGAAAFILALGLRIVEIHRARRLSAALRGAVGAGDRLAVLAHVAGAIGSTARIRWAAVIGPDSIQFDWGDRATAPGTPMLASWLMREAEGADGVVRATGAELGCSGSHLAVALRPLDEARAHLVLTFEDSVPRHVELALEASLAELAPALGRAGPTSAPRPLSVAAAS